MIKYCLCIFVLSSLLLAQNSNPMYYYGGGEKIDVFRLQDVIGICWRDNVGNNKKVAVLNELKSLVNIRTDINLEKYHITILYGKDLFSPITIRKIFTYSEIVDVYPLLCTQEGDSLILTHELIVKVKSSITIDEIKAIRHDPLLKEDPNDITYKIYKANDDSPLSAIVKANALTESNYVEYSCPNFIRRISFQSTPNDPFWPSQWALQKINMPSAWDYETGRSYIKVAIFDGGVDLVHPDLAATIAPGYDAWDNDFVPQCIDEYAHGTACAGIVAAVTHNNTGIAGVAGGWSPIGGCKIMPIRIAYDDISWVSEDDIKSCFQWAADHEAKIFSNSWMILGTNQSDPIHSGIQYAVNHGCLVLFAAGNSSNDVRYPARDPLCKAVGATDQNDQRWYYSCYGNTLDIVAPSGDINLAGDIVTTDNVGAAGYVTGDYIQSFGGTSAACPFVAGMAALIWSANPGQTANDVWSALVQEAKDLGTSGWDQYYGWGRINYTPSEQPDNQIKPWWGTFYIGDGVYNSNGSGQNVLQFADPNQWAVCHVKIENDGDASDIFKVKATETGSGTWTTRYYDALSGGNDITSQITSASGWMLSINPGSYREIRVEVRPGSNMQGNVKRVQIITSSWSALITMTDVVLMDTQCNRLQPDNLIKNGSESSFIGNNIYNSTGNNQTKQQDVGRGQKATYHIKVENDGETYDIPWIYGPAGNSEWTIKYFDALSGGNDITSQIVEGTYWVYLQYPGSVAYIRLEVTPNSTAPMGSQKDVLVTSTAGYNANKKDAIKAITRVRHMAAIITGFQSTEPPNATAYNNAHRMLKDNNSNLHLVYTNGDNIYHTFLQDTIWSEPAFLGEGKYPTLALGIDGKIYCIWCYHGYQEFEGVPYYVEYLRMRSYNGVSWSKPTKLLFHTYGTYLWGVGAPSLAINDTMACVTFKSYHGPTFNPTPGEPYPHVIVVEGPALIYGKFPLNNPDAYTYQIIDTIIKTPNPVDTLVYRDSLVPLLISPSITNDIAGIPHILWEGDSLAMKYYTITDTAINRQIFDNNTNANVDFPSLATNGDQVQLLWTAKDSIRYRYGWTNTENLSQPITIAACENPVACGPYLAWTKQDEYLSHLYYGAIPASGAVDPIEINYSTDLINYPQILFNPEKQNQTPSLDLVWTEYSQLDSLGYIYYLNLPLTEEIPVYSFDMGTETPVPILIHRDGYLTYGSEDFKTIDYDNTELIYHLTLHSPHEKYKIKWTYYHQEPNKIKLDFSIDDILHHNRWINPCEQVTQETWIPDACLQDNEITIKVKKLSGTLAVLSGFQIYEHPAGGGGPQGSEVMISRPFFLDRIYPNPAKGMIKIRFNSPDERFISIKLYDVTGRFVNKILTEKAHAGMNYVSTNIGVLPNGIYFVKLEAGGYCKVEKVVLLK